jgi:hypothetical protein
VKTRVGPILPLGRPRTITLASQAATANEEVRVDELEEELDRLFAAEPATFVAERDRIARELRAEDRREEAEQVKGLRKPTVSAWAVNQLARQNRREVDLLLDASHRLRQAQQGLLAGDDPRTFDEARQSQRDALRNLRRAASAILGAADRESETTLNRIMRTLQAAAVAPEGRELLARGRLTGDLEATGFDLVATVAEGSAPSRPTARPKAAKERTAPRKRAAPAAEGRAAKARQRSADRERLRTARAELRDAKATARGAEKELAAAEQTGEKVRRELARAEERIDERRSAVAAAQKNVDEAEARLRDAEKKAG